MAPLLNVFVKRPHQYGAISWPFVKECFAPGRAGVSKPLVTSGSSSARSWRASAHLPLPARLPPGVDHLSSLLRDLDSI